MKSCSMLTTALVLCLAVSTVEADRVEEARIHFRLGAVKYTEGNIDAALAQFQLAYALNPSYKIFYNIGQCYMELDRFEDAYKSFSRFLEEGALDIEEDRRIEVEKTLADLKEKMGGKEPEVEPVPVAAPPVDQAVQTEETVPVQPEVEVEEERVPDPRASDMSLKARPDDMLERDWFGVGKRDMARFEKLKRRNLDLNLTDYLVDKSKESKALFWGEIAAGALVGAGGGLLIGGIAAGGDLANAGNVGETPTPADQVAVSGALLAVLAASGLIAQIIVDALDIGSPEVKYQTRLDAEIKEREGGSHR